MMTRALVLAFLGAVIGVALGHAMASGLGAWLEAQQQYAVTGLAWRAEEFWVVAVALGVGIVAALLPAWSAYRTDVSRMLAEG